MCWRNTIFPSKKMKHKWACCEITSRSRPRAFPLSIVNNSSEQLNTLRLRLLIVWMRWLTSSKSRTRMRTTTSGLMTHATLALPPSKAETERLIVLMCLAGSSIEVRRKVRSYSRKSLSGNSGVARMSMTLSDKRATFCFSRMTVLLCVCAKIVTLIKRSRWKVYSGAWNRLKRIMNEIPSIKC